MEKVRKVKVRPTMEEAAIIMKVVIDKWLHAPNESVEPVLRMNPPDGMNWRDVPRPDTSTLSKKQKAVLLRLAQKHATEEMVSRVIPFIAHEQHVYTNVMMNSRRAKAILAVYAKLTKRTSSNKQKLFLEHIGMKHHMNKIENAFYRNKLRLAKSYIRKGFYDFETGKWNIPYITPDAIAKTRRIE